MSPATTFSRMRPDVWELGEAPRWDAATRTFTWVDILQGRAFVATFANGALTDERFFDFPVAVGAVERVSDGWQAAAGTGFWAADDDFRFREVHRVAGLDHTYRANDAACDPQGRLVAGFMTSNAEPGTGILARLSPADGGFETQILLTGCTIPNGLAWSPDGTELFHADSGMRVITRYAYGEQLTAPAVIAEFSAREGVADGMATDADGNLWVAMWGGSELRCYSPAGRLIDRVPLPVENPTSLCFAGPDLDVVLVTSARYGLENPSPIDGALLVGSVGVAGAIGATS